MLALTAGAWPLAAQTQTPQQFVATVETGIQELVATLPADPGHRIIFGGNLVEANGTRIGQTSVSELINYVDGLKAAGAQRVEMNPGISTMQDTGNIAKYDAVIKHIREVGMQLVLNPIVFSNDFNNFANPPANFADFQTAAIQAYTVLAQRYHPDNLVLVHEPDTNQSRLGFNTNISEWHNFILATGPAVKAVSPHTRVGAGCYYNTSFGPYMKEDAYFQDFATNIPACTTSLNQAGQGCLDFMTMDMYSEDFSKYQEWATLARQNGKGVYIEETWAPHDLPPANLIPPGSNPDDAALVGPTNSVFSTMDIDWLKAIMLFASANNMEAMTAFTTQAFFVNGVNGADKPDNSTYLSMVTTAVNQGSLTSTGTAFQMDSQQLGINEAINLSSASFATIPTVFPTMPTAPLTVVAPDDLPVAFGADLGTGTVLDGTFPTTLGGTTATISDSTNTSYPVPLYFVSPTQINYNVPSNVMPGPGTLTVSSPDGTQSTGFVLILPVMPGLYAENQDGKGVAAAVAICAGVCSNWPNQLANGQFYQNVFTLSSGTYVPVPISVANGDTVVVELYGTGFRHLSSQSALTATINQQNVPVLFVGAQGQFTGLDQVNLQIPSSLAGSGEVNVVLTVQDTVNNVNATANTVTISIQ